MKKEVTKLMSALLVTIALLIASPVSSANAAPLFCDVTETLACIETIDQGDTLTVNFDPGLAVTEVEMTNESLAYNASVLVQDNGTVSISVQQTETEIYPVSPPQAITFTNISENPNTPVRIFLIGRQYS